MSIIRKIAMVIIGLALLSLWSNFVFKNAENKGKPGFFNNTIRAFSTMPSEVNKYLKNLEYLDMSQTYLNLDPNFEEVNNLQQDLFILNGHWDENASNWIVDLTNLRTDEVLHEWQIDASYIDNEKYDRLFRDQRPFHSYLSQDGSLVVDFAQTETLLRFDKDSKLLWKNEDYGYHHSINADSSGFLWICASKFGYNNLEFGGNDVALMNLNKQSLPYQDNLICKVDIETGETLWVKSVTDILMENDLEGILFNSLDYRGDPIHLNDVEPALTTTKYWNEGDLFISIRNLGIIILYDPETNDVKRVVGGPILAQHDVDITSDSTIAIFDNRINVSGKYVAQMNREMDVKQTLHSNRIVSFDFSTGEFSYPYLDFFEAENIDTKSEGLFEYLDGGRVFVEEQNSGNVFVFNESSVELRKQFRVEGREKKHMTNWIRVYEENPLR